jgi:hypothetical protein
MILSVKIEIEGEKGTIGIAVEEIEEIILNQKNQKKEEVFLVN